MSGYRVEASRLVPVDPGHAFDTLLSAPLPSVFASRFAAIPAVRGVRDQAGEWGIVGQTRTILLGDGGTLHETITLVDRPRSFGYVIDEVTGPLRLLAGSVEGVWSFTPEGPGVRIGWTWTLDPTLHPTVGPSRLAMPAFGWMWQRYAALALRRIEAILTA